VAVQEVRWEKGGSELVDDYKIVMGILSSFKDKVISIQRKSDKDLRRYSFLVML